LEWLGAISPEYARQLRDLRREEVMAVDVRERSRQIIERLWRERGTFLDILHYRAAKM
jgi:hypothetical protein